MRNQTAFLTYSGIIPLSASKLAQKLSSQQATPQKGEQVCLNILAVGFVNSYLQYMGFETNLEASDSWNPVEQLLMDVADLSIKNIGSLECRPVLEGEEFVYVPPEALTNRIGYVVVQIHKSLREAKLLGFVQEASTNLLAISQLSSLENLLSYLEYLNGLNIAKSAIQSPINNSLVNLRKWLENIVDTGWQEIEYLLGSQAIYADSSLRNTSSTFISRGKLVELGQGDTAPKVVLVVTLTPESEQEVDIIVEIHPTQKELYLPANLQLQILDFEGVCVMEAQTRNTNKNIQLQFSGEIGEHFSVKLVLEDTSAIENFAI
ncbi:DUF1822 family protein [Nostoc sp. FACHB-152]|uniref:DUF1822 family protein n=1 Tax=unclassified Nostoc TaxID=2593658 RepID=UPI001689DEF9|nr:MULTISPECIES: DUF1822 family protein [unclassified Nostoc]MBD2450316.1 DUF1822 family protein [Nostoc sp. FACHB-152]MBD2471780.1 DUF1822 family protein [Nostoc sp. FACHB-145]